MLSRETLPAMQANGSPDPVFETDEDYNYFLVVLPIHHLFSSDTHSEGTEWELQILNFCITPQKSTAILEELKVSNHPNNYKRYIIPLIEKGWLNYTLEGKPTSPNQRYVTTKRGKGALE